VLQCFDIQRNNIDENNLDDEPKAMTLRDLFFQRLEEKMVELDTEENFLHKVKLQESIQQFRVRPLCCLFTPQLTSR
jgi:hypothetical protein